MATTDFSKSGDQVLVTVGGTPIDAYDRTNSDYNFLNPSSSTSPIQVIFVKAGITIPYVVSRADLSVGGASMSGSSNAEVLTAMAAVWVDSSSVTLYTTLPGNSQKTDGAATPKYVTDYVAANPSTNTLQQVVTAGNVVVLQDGNNAFTINNSNGDPIAVLNNLGDEDGSLKMSSAVAAHTAAYRPDRIAVVDVNGAPYNIGFPALNVSDADTNKIAAFQKQYEDFEVVKIGNGYILASPNGTRYRIKVANDGTLSTETV